MKARSAEVQTPAPGPSPTGPALSLWYLAAELSGMQNALAGQTGEEGAGWLLPRQGCPRSARGPSPRFETQLRVTWSESSSVTKFVLRAFCMPGTV